MFKWYHFVLVWLVLSVVISYHLMGYYYRDHGECWFPREECWVDMDNSTYYGGFWCDCDNFEKELRENTHI